MNLPESCISSIINELPVSDRHNMKLACHGMRHAVLRCSSNIRINLSGLDAGSVDAFDSYFKDLKAVRTSGGSGIYPLRLTVENCTVSMARTLQNLVARTDLSYVSELTWLATPSIPVLETPLTLLTKLTLQSRSYGKYTPPAPDLSPSDAVVFAQRMPHLTDLTVSSDMVNLTRALGPQLRRLHLTPSRMEDANKVDRDEKLAAMLTTACTGVTHFWFSQQYDYSYHLQMLRSITQHPTIRHVSMWSGIMSWDLDEGFEPLPCQWETLVILTSEYFQGLSLEVMFLFSFRAPNFKLKCNKGVLYASAHTIPSSTQAVTLGMQQLERLVLAGATEPRIKRLDVFWDYSKLDSSSELAKLRLLRGCCGFVTHLLFPSDMFCGDSVANCINMMQIVAETLEVPALEEIVLDADCCDCTWCDGWWKGVHTLPPTLTIGTKTIRAVLLTGEEW